jgi:hypothetical protein
MKITKVINLIISDITKVDLILTLELECMWEKYQTNFILDLQQCNWNK